MLSACGGGGSSYSEVPQAPNSAPYFVSLPDEVSVAENQLDVITVVAEDSDGDYLVFSLSGTDKDYFNISPNGVITFNTTPVYEEKSQYLIDINVSDGEITTSSD